jgi:hypothetical protein
MIEQSSKTMQGVRTLQMRIDPETFLRITVLALADVLNAADQKFLEQSMRSYARLYRAANDRMGCTDDRTS